MINATTTPVYFFFITIMIIFSPLTIIGQRKQNRVHLLREEEDLRGELTCPHLRYHILS